MAPIQEYTRTSIPHGPHPRTHSHLNTPRPPTKNTLAPQYPMAPIQEHTRTSIPHGPHPRTHSHLNTPRPPSKSTLHLNTPRPPSKSTLHLNTPWPPSKNTRHLNTPRPPSKNTRHPFAPNHLLGHLPTSTQGSLADAPDKSVFALLLAQPVVQQSRFLLPHMVLANWQRDFCRARLSKIHYG
jgi:hypothetical protein